ncbi:hypothetical protein PCASD_12062 [Puccinia coronata f. sp. avenae]|uniref:Uncharacterized protein n=1 Tax=Puccinia coronata f. sp. avenae TaxID=200324 RepID=A0A2N5UEU9_9BASI|nr:hypothetical protein PCASD_12062 [Puccinia coronata f. sp. avenae]
MPLATGAPPDKKFLFFSFCATLNLRHQTCTTSYTACIQRNLNGLSPARSRSAHPSHPIRPKKQVKKFSRLPQLVPPKKSTRNAIRKSRRKMVDLIEQTMEYLNNAAFGEKSDSQDSRLSPSPRAKKYVPFLTLQTQTRSQAQTQGSQAQTNGSPVVTRSAAALSGAFPLMLPPRNGAVPKRMAPPHHLVPAPLPLEFPPVLEQLPLLLDTHPSVDFRLWRRWPQLLPRDTLLSAGFQCWLPWRPPLPLDTPPSAGFQLWLPWRLLPRQKALPLCL